MKLSNFKQIAFGIAAIIVSSVFFWLYSSINSLQQIWQPPNAMDLQLLVAGTADRPYVYRVLMPILIRAFSALVHLPAEQYAAMFIYLSLIGFVFSIYRLTQYFWPSPKIAYTATLLAVPSLIPLVLIDNHIYDLPQLFLFTLSLEFMIKKRWGLFILTYILTCLNKETAIFLTLIFLVCYYSEMGRSRLIKLASLQIGIYVALRSITLYVFRNNPGAIMEYHLVDQLLAFRDYYPPWGMVGIVFHLILTSLITWLIIRHWSIKPIFLRRAALTVTPIFLVLYWLFGYPFELRVFLEIFPLLYLLAIPPLLASKYQSQSRAFAPNNGY